MAGPRDRTAFLMFQILAEVLEVSVSRLMASDPPKVQCMSMCSYGLLEIGTE